MTPRHIVTFDVETTGVDVYQDRIVQAFLGLMTPDGHFQLQQEWVINPGVPVPQGAADVHGFTTERLQAIGTHPHAALEQIRSIIEGETYDQPDVALVIYNAPFDTTMLNSELVRHGFAPLDFTRINVVDPYVLDKRIYKFRKGAGMRKLTAVAPIYGVPVEENAHDAGADCLMTGRLAYRMLANKYLQGQSLATLQRYQAEWKADQSADLEKWFRSPKAGAQQDPNIVIDRSWPIQYPQAA